MSTLEQLRREYLQGGLRRSDLSADPMTFFNGWMQQALDSQIQDATAMTLATVNAKGQASQRIVLLKEANERGLVFYTNYASAKALDVAANHRVSLHFSWLALERQVSFKGDIEKTTREESAAYFASRPKESQIAALASHQSESLASRQELVDRYQALMVKYADKTVPAPEFWGGYRVKPDFVEFWQGGQHRLHDRFAYSLSKSRLSKSRLSKNKLSKSKLSDGRLSDGNMWQIERLAP